MISPMLASPAVRKGELQRGRWVAEEKYDGHRLIVVVKRNFGARAWSRAGNERDLSPSLRTAMATCLAPGMYDGELIVPHGPRERRQHSYDVANLDNRHRLAFVAFDMLYAEEESLLDLAWLDRRIRLGRSVAPGAEQSRILLSSPLPVDDWQSVDRLAADIWHAGGEGLILKDTLAPYRIGKRTKSFLKVKSCSHALLRITGWTEGTTGPFCVADLIDEQGNTTGVKALDDETRAAINANPQSFIGKMLWIEYQERTPSGSYISPRWDRLEEE